MFNQARTLNFIQFHSVTLNFVPVICDGQMGQLSTNKNIIVIGLVVKIQSSIARRNIQRISFNRKHIKAHIHQLRNYVRYQVFFLVNGNMCGIKVVLNLSFFEY